MNQHTVDPKKDKRLLVLFVLGALIMVPHFIRTNDLPGEKEMFLWIAQGEDYTNGRLHVVPGSWPYDEFSSWYEGVTGHDDGRQVWARLRKDGGAAVGVHGIAAIEDCGEPRLLPLLGMPIPINRADAQTIAMAPGIGPTLAARIIEFRTRHSKITEPSMLLEIQGIGPVLLAKSVRYFTFD